MSIEDLIDTITSQDFSKAGPLFSDIIGDKIDMALEQEKIRLADVTFNGAEEDDEEQLELDLGDDDEGDGYEEESEVEEEETIDSEED